MGVFGLRKFIDAASCTKFLPMPSSENDGDHQQNEEQEQQGDNHNVTSSSSFSSSTTGSASVDHVLVDLNCIIHACFRHDAAAVNTKRDLIQAVLQRLQFLLTHVAVPSMSLTICIDGPAPYAKLHTQRLRRRRVALLDTCSSQEEQQKHHNLTTLAVTPGSLFLVELENALAAQFKLGGGSGFLPTYVPVFLHGSTVIGEGEAKIARALAHIATFSFPQCKKYNPNNTIAVIGNDIDLTLTCMGATQYHNLFVVGPSSMQLISVSDILYRWLCSSTTMGEGGFKLTPRELASVRVDFVFLFLLNGGDHYVGAGEVAHALWKRYRTVRAASAMQRSLITNDLLSVDVEFLADVLQAEEYTGECDASVGMQLLHAALWSLHTTVTGVCPDYQYVPQAETTTTGTNSPHLNHVRAAVLQSLKKKRKHQLNRHPNHKHNNNNNSNSNSNYYGDNQQEKYHYIRFTSNREDSRPLTPLETFVALMPTESALPASVAQTLRASRKYAAIAQQLLNSYDAEIIATAAKEAVEASDECLTVSERCLREFTTPVQLNALQPPKRLSRHEQHRMIAKMGKVVREPPIPLVQRVTLPENVQYVNVDYPFYVKDLLFVSPFDRPDSDELPQSSAVFAASGLTTTPVPLNANKTMRDKSENNNNNKKNPNEIKPKVRRIPVHPHKQHMGEEEEEISATQQLQETLAKTAALRLPAGRDKKTLRRLKKKLNTHRQLSVKEAREGESTGEARQHLLRRNDTEFLDEIRQFLGEDKVSVKKLLQNDQDKKKNNNNNKNNTNNTNNNNNKKKQKKNNKDKHNGAAEDSSKIKMKKTGDTRNDRKDNSKQNTSTHGLKRSREATVNIGGGGDINKHKGDSFVETNRNKRRRQEVNTEIYNRNTNGNSGSGITTAAAASASRVTKRQK